MAEERSAETDAGTAGRSSAAGRSYPPLPAAEERGTLEVSPNVVRKVAQRVADHAPGTLWTPHRITDEHGSSARIDGTGNTVDIMLDVALRYPAPVREITEEVRRQVTDEVQRITGYRVRGVQVTVSALLPEIRPRVV